MAFTLRPYQRAAVDAGLRSLAGAAGAGLLVEPTGSGKSLIIGAIATRLDKPTVVFQPTRELVVQNASKLMSFGFAPSIYSASLGEKRIGQVTLATIGSVKDPGLFKDFGFAIFDECDLVNAKGGQLSGFLAANPTLRVLGLTATPFRLSTDAYGGAKLRWLTRTRPRVFTDVVHWTQINDLMRMGFLCPLTYHVVPGFDAAKIAANSTGADFDLVSTQRYLEQIDFRDRTRRVVERLLERGRRHVLCFVAFVEDAEVLAEHIPGAAIVTGKTPDKERDSVISAFKSGEVPVVVNVNCLTAGFDFPALDTVVLARPSMSLRVYMQQVGRVVRPSPETGKAEAWVVDLVGMVQRFGKLEDLEIQAGGKSGDLWEFTSRGKPITNVYYGPKPDKRNQFWRRRATGARW